MILGKNLAIRHIGIVIARCFRLRHLGLRCGCLRCLRLRCRRLRLRRLRILLRGCICLLRRGIGLLGICILRRFLLHSLTKDKDSYEQQMSELDTILDERQNELSSLDDSMRAAYSDISDIQSQIDAQNSKMASILAEEKAAAKAKAEHEAAVKQEA